MKVLVTGFDPFGGESINPAYEAVKLLPDAVAGADLVKVEVPTVFGKSIDRLKMAMEREKPDLVLCVGQAGGRFDLTIERVAINMDDARIKDNEGNQPIDEPIFGDGEPAYFSNLPIKAMVANVRDKQLTASVSNTAGTFVCNHLMYGLLYMIDKEFPGVRGGFVHVPYIVEQVVDKRNMPSMSVDNIAKGLEAMIEAAVENQEDIKVAEGKIC
jgi:pyroglutamyl-peptidase